MIRKFIRWFKRVIIGEKEPEEICETTIMPEEERRQIREEAETDIWNDVRCTEEEGKAAAARRRACRTCPAYAG